jgi:hypothetical protein
MRSKALVRAASVVPCVRLDRQPLSNMGLSDLILRRVLADSLF